MSGIAQGVPQRITSFVDPKTGIMTPAWYRFFYSLWERTGGAPAASTTDDVIGWMNMADTPVSPPPEGAAMMAFLMADAAVAAPAGYVDIVGDTPAPAPPESAAWLDSMRADTAGKPENDPALVALMVADA